MAVDEHSLIAEVKRQAIELDRTPTYKEFCSKVVGGEYNVSRLFRNYTILLQAAGLETYDQRRSKKKLTRQEFFGADLVETLAEHKPRVVESQPQDFEPILEIGDTHFPFVHQPTLEKMYRFAEREQPGYIVQLGDLNDQFSHGRFAASRNFYKPDDEMAQARKQAVEFWATLRKLCPSAKLKQIVGNHDVRPLKQALANAPSLESLVRESLYKLYEFEGVETIHDYREELIIQGIMHHHGYMTRHGQQRDFVMQSLVSGHTHRGNVSYRALKDRTIWSLDAGFLGDAESKAMSYTSQKTTGWTLGWGFVDRYGPRFIPG